MDEQAIPSIGQHISLLRNERGISAEELARLIGKDSSTVYRYENGEIQDISVTVILDIAKALDVSFTELIDWEKRERVPLDVAKEKAAAIMLRQLEKAEDAFEIFMRDKEQKDRPALFKENLLPALSQLGNILLSLRY